MLRNREMDSRNGGQDNSRYKEARRAEILPVLPESDNDLDSGVRAHHTGNTEGLGKPQPNVSRNPALCGGVLRQLRQYSSFQPVAARSGRFNREEVAGIWSLRINNSLASAPNRGILASPLITGREA